MVSRRNSDAQMRELHRRAGTGDLEAAKLLVLALERAGRNRVLAEPLSLEQIRDMASENDGWVTGVVSVDLAEVIDGDIEVFNDILSERLTGGGLLSDIGYRVVGLGESINELLIEVSGDAAMILDDAPLPSCTRCAAEAIVEIDDSPLCDACSQVQDSCDDGCMEHARDCDGFCDHARPSHMNACLADDEARIARIQTERRGEVPPPPRFTLRELSAMPTLGSGHFDDVKYEQDGWRVSVSRQTVADGAPYPNQVTVEHLVDGVWEEHETYRPAGAPRAARPPEPSDQQCGSCGRGLRDGENPSNWDTDDLCPDCQAE